MEANQQLQPVEIGRTERKSTALSDLPFMFLPFPPASMNVTPAYFQRKYK